MSCPVIFNNFLSSLTALDILSSFCPLHSIALNAIISVIRTWLGEFFLILLKMTKILWLLKLSKFFTKIVDYKWTLISIEGKIVQWIIVFLRTGSNYIYFCYYFNVVQKWYQFRAWKIVLSEQLLTLFKNHIRPQIGDCSDFWRCSPKYSTKFRTH